MDQQPQPQSPQPPRPPGEFAPLGGYSPPPPYVQAMSPYPQPPFQPRPTPGPGRMIAIISVTVVITAILTTLVNASLNSSSRTSTAGTTGTTASKPQSGKMLPSVAASDRRQFVIDPLLPAKFSKQPSAYIDKKYQIQGLIVDVRFADSGKSYFTTEDSTGQVYESQGVLVLDLNGGASSSPTIAYVLFNTDSSNLVKGRGDVVDGTILGSYTYQTASGGSQVAMLVYSQYQGTMT